MTKKKSPGLTERIEHLVSALGAKPEPNFGHIKSVLIEILPLAQELESGAAIRDAEAQVAAFDTALEEANAKNASLQAELQNLNTELQTFRSARKKQEEEERRKDIPPIQFKVLKSLPLVNDYGSKIPDIARACGIPADEAEVHVDALCKARLAKKTYKWPKVNESVFRRTMAGNRHVVAKRLAGEAEDEEKPQRTHADRTKLEEEIMDRLAMNGDMSCEDFGDVDDNISCDQADVALHDLEKAGLIRVIEPAAQLGEPWERKEAKYNLSVEGTRYMLERGLLPGGGL